MAKSIKKNPENAHWLGRMGKRSADERSFYSMRDWIDTKPDKTKTVLSLPAADWMWETQFASVFDSSPVDFIGIESNAEVHREASKTAATLSQLRPNHSFAMHPEPTDAFNLLMHTDQVFDMIYLDWMGTWAQAKCNQIDAILERRLIRKGGILRFTISLERGQSDFWKPLCEPFMDDLYGFQDMRGGGGPLQEWKIYGIPGLVLDKAKVQYPRTRLIVNLAYMSRETIRSKGIAELSVMYRLR